MLTKDAVAVEALQTLVKLNDTRGEYANQNEWKNLHAMAMEKARAVIS